MEGPVESRCTADRGEKQVADRKEATTPEQDGRKVCLARSRARQK